MIRGGTSSASAGTGAPVDRTGGLLALSSNIGDYDRTKLVLLRDMSINVGYCLTPNVMLRLGFDFMWVSNVLRPGEQIDLGVNPTLLPFSGCVATVGRRDRRSGSTARCSGCTASVSAWPCSSDGRRQIDLTPR